MKITSAEFVRGVVKGNDFGDDSIPQIAFYGRSNVGKSSTINALINNKKLARSSKTPGRTQEINFFLINNAFYVVDLPGYGYAKLSKESRNKLQDLITWYMLETHVPHRMNVFILDAKIGLTDLDREKMKPLIDQRLPILILANKIDRLNQKETMQALKNIRQEIPEHIEVIPFSAEKKRGVEEFWSIIEQ